MAEIVEVSGNKRDYLDLLLLADEQEQMIDTYLDRGDMFVLREGGAVRAECVVTREAPGVYEIKNIATAPAFQRRGYARMLIAHVLAHYPDCTTMYVGTGDSPLTIPFYESCGFRESHRVSNFFLEHYDHPIFEAGRQLVDMVYLKREPPRGE